MLEELFRIKISTQITLIRGHGRLCQKRFFITLFSVDLLDSFLRPESESSKQSVGCSSAKLSIPIVHVTATNIPMYFNDNLQRILKTVLEAQILTSAPAPALTPAPATFEELQDKLNSRSPDVNRGKPHMNCYKFCH